MPKPPAGRAYPESTRRHVVFCMLRGFGVDNTRRELRQRGGALEGLLQVPSRATCFRIWRRFKRTRQVAGRMRPGRTLGLGGEQICAIKAWCERPGGQRRGTRISKLRTWFDARYNRLVPKQTLCWWLKRLGLTRKKGTRTPLQQDPEKIACFWERAKRLGLDPWRTVWFDEVGFDFRDFRMEYGWSPRGKRFYTVEKVGRGERVNGLAAMSARGMFFIDFYHKGGVGYDEFEATILRVAGKMARLGYNHLVMDNARIHHAHDDRVASILQHMGIRVHWLAPYWPQGAPVSVRLSHIQGSSELLTFDACTAGNPIENMFGWIKCEFKEHRDDAEGRPVDEICALVRRLFREAGQDQRAFRWVRRCGYFV